MNNLKSKFQPCPEVFNALLFVLFGAIVVFFTKSCFTIFAPFIIAYVVTQVLHPLLVKIRNKIKIPNVLNTVLCLVIFSTVVGCVIWILVHYLANGVSYLINLLSSKSTMDAVVEFANELGTKLDDVLDFMNIEISVSNISEVVGDFTKNAIQVLSNFSINLAMGLPGFLMAFIIGCIAAFYMLCDYDKISNYITNRLSPKTKKFVDVFNAQVLSSFVKMLMSYAVMSAICFCELLIGFVILDINDSAFIALIIAILDVFPILGSGAVLIPWGIVSIILGKPLIGIGVLVLYAIITVVRQILEPRIVGSQIGLYPLITLASLYLGLRFMGGLGLIMGPLYVIFFKKLYEERLIGMRTRREDARDAEKEIARNN